MRLRRCRCACGALLVFPTVWETWPDLMLLHVRTEQHARWSLGLELATRA